jgi:hypothetical protein
MMDCPLVNVLLIIAHPKRAFLDERGQPSAYSDQQRPRETGDWLNPVESSRKEGGYAL